MIRLCACCSEISRRNFLVGSTTLLIAPTPASAQTRWTGGLAGSCSFYPNDIVEQDLYTFGSDMEAFDVVRRITSAVGLQPNFEVLQANVPNAAAVIRGERRYILFSQVFIRQIVRATSTEWASWTIMAHEVGHHLNGHTLVPGGSRPPSELEADRFAGHAVRRLGGSLDDALACFRQMSPDGSSTHPPRSARLEAVSRGWHEAMAPTSGVTQRQEAPGQKPRPTQELRRVKQDVSLGYLNLRDGPGTNSKVVVRIPAGTPEIRLSGRCIQPKDGSSRFPFCLVEWNGYEGWVSSNGLE